MCHRIDLKRVKTGEHSRRFSPLLREGNWWLEVALATTNGCLTMDMVVAAAVAIVP